MRRWVGLGIIADNLIDMGRGLAQQPSELDARFHDGRVK